jgi:taurine-pyruvate aminotransferase
VTTEAVFDLFKDDVDDPLSYFRDISTFGGCTAGPAAALENLRILEDEQLLDNATAMGARLMDGLRALGDKHAVVGNVRGLGLFGGVELVADRTTREPLPEAKVASVAAAAMARGVQIGMTNRSLAGFNNVLLFSPALIATPSDIDQIVDTMDEALATLG